VPLDIELAVMVHERLVGAA